MTSYRIKFYDEHGALSAQDVLAFAVEGDAIDYVDRIRHPHELHLLQGDRLVARFDPDPTAQKTL